MFDRNDGACTKEEAYASLKEAMSLPKKVKIFKKFFKIFFYKPQHQDLYLPLMDEVSRDNFIIKHNLKQVNLRIHAVKKRYPKIAFRMYDKAIIYLKEQIRG